MSTSVIKAFLVTCFITLLSISAHADVVDEIERNFNVEHNSTFELDNINGSVAITAWENSTIRVSATIKADSQEDRDNVVIDMQQTSSGVSVETRYKKRNSWKHNRSGKVEYIIMVPKSISLSAINLVNGSLTIDNVQGLVQAELVNGSIKASGLANNSNLSSVNGSIKVTYSELAIDLSHINIDTVNGSIKLLVPHSLNANVKAETMHGSIKTDFGLVAQNNLFTGRHLQGEIGSGGVDVTLTSVNGSIKLLK